MEKAILVTYDLRCIHHEETRIESEEAAMKDLNEHLADGWKVSTISPLSGTDTSYSSAIVVLCKDQ